MEEVGYDVTEDVTLNDLKSKPVPAIKNAIGTVMKIEMSPPMEKTGNQFVNVTIRYPYGQAEADQSEIRAAFTFNRQRMAEGADNSDLEKGIQTSIGINKRLGKQLILAVEGANSFQQTVGAKIGFNAGPSYNEESEYEYKKFFKPKT